MGGPGVPSHRAPSPPRRASRAAYGYEYGYEWYGYAYQGLWYAYCATMTCIHYGTHGRNNKFVYLCKCQRHNRYSTGSFVDAAASMSAAAPLWFMAHAGRNHQVPGAHRCSSSAPLGQLCRPHHESRSKGEGGNVTRAGVMLIPS